MYNSKNSSRHSECEKSQEDAFKREKKEYKLSWNEAQSPGLWCFSEDKIETSDKTLVHFLFKEDVIQWWSYLSSRRPVPYFGGGEAAFHKSRDRLKNSPASIKVTSILLLKMKIY